GLLRRAQPRPRPAAQLSALARAAEPGLHGCAPRFPGLGCAPREGGCGPPGPRALDAPSRGRGPARLRLRAGDAGLHPGRAVARSRPAADRHGGVPPAARRVPPRGARGGAQGMTPRRQPPGEAVPWVMYERLPGGDLVEAGLRDLRAGEETAPALLVAAF